MGGVTGGVVTLRHRLLKQQSKVIVHEAVTGKNDLSAAPAEAGLNPKT